METFRTILETPNYPFKIDLNTTILSVGSCFADHMGTRLMDNKCRILLNPNGILYNPLSITRCLEAGLVRTPDVSEVLVHHHDLWHSMDHHGSFSTSNRQDIVHKMMAAHKQLHHFIPSTQVLICTFGSANVYYYKKTSLPVANCHKLPSSAFLQNITTAQEIVDRFIPLFGKLKQINPSIRILLSVSPVRHLKDGIIENQFSKAQLISACHFLCREFEFCHYFPAYEWLMDDLRDYRFYAPDMVHPDPTAIDYIWKNFKKSLLSESLIRFTEDLEKAHKSLLHKPLFPETRAHQHFLTDLKSKLDKLAAKYPDISFKKEYGIWNTLGALA